MNNNSLFYLPCIFCHTDGCRYLMLFVGCNDTGHRYYGQYQANGKDKAPADLPDGGSCLADVPGTGHGGPRGPVRPRRHDHPLRWKTSHLSAFPIYSSASDNHALSSIVWWQTDSRVVIGYGHENNASNPGLFVNQPFLNPHRLDPCRRLLVHNISKSDPN